MRQSAAERLQQAINKLDPLKAACFSRHHVRGLTWDTWRLRCCSSTARALVGMAAESCVRRCRPESSTKAEVL